eukprot:9504056-Pyramimonas_sp.AAC.3
MDHDVHYLIHPLSPFKVGNGGRTSGPVLKYNHKVRRDNKYFTCPAVQEVKASQKQHINVWSVMGQTT